jgi:VWFA-related protein
MTFRRGALLLAVLWARSALSGTTQQPESVAGLGVSVELVQVDAVVTDAHRHAVTDLAREDFEILEDGRVRPIANFAYVSAVAASGARSAAPAGAGAEGPNAPAPAPAVGRIVALVVDDLNLSPGEMGAVKDALGKFVKRQMGPSDRVCLLSTGAVPTILTFTGDRGVVGKAIESLRWNPQSHRYRSIPPIAIGFAEGKQGQRRQPGTEQERPDVDAIRSMNAVESIAKDLEPLPGRKALILFSSGLRVVSVLDEESRRRRREEGKGNVEEALQLLADAANRATVVIYTIDMRGLQTLTMEADDYVTVPGFIPIQEDELSLRRHEFPMAQEGLQELAHETGGLFFGGTDPSVGLDRAMADQEGYYLLGYLLDPVGPAPPDHGRAYHEIEVKVRRPHVQVRARSRFYAALR